jgi:hypothetical protein
MPVELAKTAGLYSHDGRGDIRCGKVLVIDDLDLSPRDSLCRFHAAGPEDKLLVGFVASFRSLSLLLVQKAAADRFER